MSIHTLFAATAALTLCSTAAFADGHSDRTHHIRSNLCEKSRATLAAWGKTAKPHTAYAMNVTSDQAAATCYDFNASNTFYAVHSPLFQSVAKTQALKKCVLDKSSKGWCVIIGVVTD